MATYTYHYLSVLFCFAVLYLKVADADITVYDAYNETMETFSDTEVFQGSGLSEGLKGLLLLADPFDACTPIREAFNSSVLQSFALIFGNISSDCPGGLEVLHAQESGFDAVIMFSDMHPFDGFTVSKDIVIPVLIVEYKTGMKMRNNYIFQKTNGSNFYWFKLTAKEYINVPLRLLILCAVVFAFAVGVALVLTIFMYIKEVIGNCINRYRSNPLRHLRTERFTSDMPYDTCTICLEEYRRCQKLRILPCNHAYHTQCIDPWLLDNHYTCPLCKRRIRDRSTNSEGSNNSESSSDSETSPLIPRQITMDPESLNVMNWVMQRRLRMIINQLESDQICQDTTGTEDSSCTNLLTDAHCSGEMIVNHHLPTTYGSVNSDEGEEFFDALTSGEISTSSDVHM